MWASIVGQPHGFRWRWFGIGAPGEQDLNKLVELAYVYTVKLQALGS